MQSQKMAERKMRQKDNLKYYKFLTWYKGTIMNNAWIDKHKKEAKYFWVVLLLFV